VTTTESAIASPLLVSVDRAAEMLGIGRTRAYELVGTGELPSVLIGRSRRVAVVDVVAYVDRLRDRNAVTDRGARDTPTSEGVEVVTVVPYAPSEVPL
jgi:excisionase family DNA binding protein